jgi:hypothetical protein
MLRYRFAAAMDLMLHCTSQQYIPKPQLHLVSPVMNHCKQKDLIQMSELQDRFGLP